MTWLVGGYWLQVAHYNGANREVAILCNHQKTVSSAQKESLGKMQEQLDMLHTQKHVRPPLVFFWNGRGPRGCILHASVWSDLERTSTHRSEQYLSCWLLKFRTTGNVKRKILFKSPPPPLRTCHIKSAEQCLRSLRLGVASF